MRKILIILVLTAGSYATGQDYNGLYFDMDSVKGSIQLEGFSAVQSNALTNSFINKFLKGGYIDDDIKSSSRNRLQNNNYVNLGVQGALTYVDYAHAISKKHQLYPSLGISTNVFAGGRFNQDFYDIAMYGNAPDRGYDLNNTFALQYLTQGIHLGVHQKKSGSFVSVGILNGSSMNYLNVNKLQFVTDDQAEEIGVVVNGQAAQNAGNPFFSPSGIGFAVNATFNFDVAFGDSDSAMVWPFQFVVKDFGMVFWNDNTTTYTAEGAFDYSGVDPVNNEGLNIIGDIVPEEAITEKNQKSHTFLAGNLGFHKTPKFKQQGIQPIFGIDVYFTRSLIPRGYIGAFVKPAKWFDFNASIAYGGYGGIQDHIGVGFNIKKAVRLGVFSHNTFSSIINAGYGYSLGFSIIGQW